MTATDAPAASDGDGGRASPALSADEAFAGRVLQALPTPVAVIDGADRLRDANAAAEAFFDLGLAHLRRAALPDLLGRDSPVLDLVGEARRSGAAVNGRRLVLGLPRSGIERAADVIAAPFPEIEGGVVVLFQERTIADKLDRQLTHRGAARSMTALGSMLAHEIKNPLSGIRGAAQLLESSLDDADRALTTLICEETDRIVRLVDRMEVFADERPADREPVNVHVVLDRVKRLAASGFARGIRFTETYDPSLPPVLGNPDQLVQVLLNLVKNAAEAIAPGDPEGEIELTTAYRPGVRLSVPGSAARVSLPLEICVKDNGAGVPAGVLPHLFDPFLTTKARGTGLGLALVAKLVGDHGGVVECQSMPRRTVFRILLPIAAARDGRGPATD